MPSSCASEYPPAQQQQYVVRQVRPAQKLEERSAQDETRSSGPRGPSLLDNDARGRAPSSTRGRRKASRAWNEQGSQGRCDFQGASSRATKAPTSVWRSREPLPTLFVRGFTGFLRGERRAPHALDGHEWFEPRLNSTALSSPRLTVARQAVRMRADVASSSARRSCCSRAVSGSRSHVSTSVRPRTPEGQRALAGGRAIQVEWPDRHPNALSTPPSAAICLSP